MCIALTLTASPLASDSLCDNVNCSGDFPIADLGIFSNFGGEDAAATAAHSRLSDGVLQGEKVNNS
jgi:hypothetical protein